MIFCVIRFLGLVGHAAVSRRSCRPWPISSAGGNSPSSGGIATRPASSSTAAFSNSSIGAPGCCSRLRSACGRRICRRLRHHGHPAGRCRRALHCACALRRCRRDDLAGERVPPLELRRRAPASSCAARSRSKAARRASGRRAIRPIRPKSNRSRFRPRSPRAFRWRERAYACAAGLNAPAVIAIESA